MRGGAWIFVLTSLVAAIAGCGDDDGGGGGSCEAFHACGGEVEGEWNVEDVCFDDAESVFAAALDDPACDGAFSGSDVHATGTYVFADGTLTTDVDLSIDLNARVTAACFEALSGASVDIVEACPALEDQFMSQGVFEAASCAVQGGACACMLTLSMPVQETGTYSIEDNALIDDMDGSSTEYCVAGDTLTLRLSNGMLDGTIMLSR